jgi:hypothetical protein
MTTTLGEADWEIAGKGKMAAEAAIALFRMSRLVARCLFIGASIRFDDALS